MAYIKQVNLEDAKGPLKRQYEAAIRRGGRVFGITKVMSQTPQALADAMRFYLTLMKREGALKQWQCEMLATVTSKANNCVY